MEHVTTFRLPVQDGKCVPITLESCRKMESGFELSPRREGHEIGDNDIDNAHLTHAPLDGQYNIRVEIINDFYAGKRSANDSSEISLPLQTPFKKPRLSVHYCSTPFPSSSQTCVDSACFTGFADASDEVRHFWFPHTAVEPDLLKEPESFKDEDEYLDDSLLDFTDEESTCSPLNFTEQEIQEILADEEATDACPASESDSFCEVRGHDDSAGHSQELQPGISVQTLASSQAKASVSSCCLINEFENEACTPPVPLHLTVDCLESLLVSSNCELDSPAEVVLEPEFDFDINELLALSPTDSSVTLDIAEHSILKKLNDEQKLGSCFPSVLEQIPDKPQPEPVKCSVSSSSLPSDAVLDSSSWSSSVRPLEFIAVEPESLRPVHTVKSTECVPSKMGLGKENVDSGELMPLLLSSLNSVGMTSSEVCLKFPESVSPASAFFMPQQSVVLENGILGTVQLRDTIGKGLSSVDVEREKLNTTLLEINEMRGQSHVFVEDKVLATACQDDEKSHGLFPSNDEMQVCSKSEYTPKVSSKSEKTPGGLKISENAPDAVKLAEAMDTSSKAEKALDAPAMMTERPFTFAKVLKSLFVNATAGKSAAFDAETRKSPASIATVRKSPANTSTVRKSPAHTAKARKSPAHTAQVRKSPAHTAKARKSPAHTAQVRKSPAHTAQVRKSPAHTAKARKSPAHTAKARKTESIAEKAVASSNVSAKVEKTTDGSVATEKQQAALHNMPQNVVIEDFGSSGTEVIAKKHDEVVAVPKADSWRNVMVDFNLARRITIPVEQLERRKRLYMQCVVNHIQNPLGSHQGAMGELLDLMDQVANVEYRGQGRHHWQHPSDLTTRNYSQFVRKSSSTYSLRQWASKNSGYHCRFQNIPDSFQRSSVPKTTPF